MFRVVRKGTDGKQAWSLVLGGFAFNEQKMNVSYDLLEIVSSAPVNTRAASCTLFVVLLGHPVARVYSLSYKTKDVGLSSN